MTPLLFALVDMEMLDQHDMARASRYDYLMEGPSRCHEEWVQFSERRALLGWWRSTWVKTGG